MDLALRDRAAVVAGGSRGMGRATAELLAREGCRVAVLGRTPDDLRPAAEALRAGGAPDGLALETDLRDAAAVGAAFQTVEARWGALDALVCAAGPGSAGTFDSVTKNLARGLAPEGILVNCICPGWVLTPSIEGHLRELAARAGLPADDLATAYTAGARSFGAGNDLGRIGRPEEIAALAVLLCSPLAAFTVGATIPVDGGTDFF